MPVGRIFISSTWVALNEFKDFVYFSNGELSSAEGDLFFLVGDSSEQIVFRRQQVADFDAVCDPLVTVDGTPHVRA